MRAHLLFVAALTALLFLAGCDCGASSVTTCGAGGCTSPDGGPRDGGNVDAGPGAITSIEVTPADITIATTVGVTKMQQYMATVTYANQSTAMVPGSFALDDISIGSIEPVSGLFTANGIVGGTADIIFTPTVGTLKGMTTVTVTLSNTILPMGVMPSPDMQFADAGAPVMDMTAQATVLYPLDGVMFPQNVNAPVVQWNQVGSAGDWFRVTYAKPHITVIDFVQNTGTFTYSEQLPDTVFSRIAETDPAAKATVVVDHLDVTGHRVVAGGAPVHMSFAQGSVSGTVYYWAMDQALLHRIPGGTTQNQALFAGGLTGTAATDPGYTYGGCIACHQISRDGRYLAANGDQSYVIDLTAADPTMPNMPVATRAGFRWFFSTISPDDTRIFATMADFSFAYTDINVQAKTPTGTLPTGIVAHPSWSPDGKTVAYISNVTGQTGNAAFTGGDLTVVNVDLATDVFSNNQVIHTGATLMTSDPAGGTADCFPTWTPDSKLLMFDHTTNTRGTGETRLPSSLYIMPPTAGAAPVRLAIASDAPTTGGMVIPQAHFPNTSPFVSGGFYWIVYYSTRDYGNALAGSAGNGNPQLWVSAISINFDGTTDPSHVPYWLPGQDTHHENADAVWAASACKATGGTCATSSDCCSGACTSQGDGGFACTTATVCRREGESCAMDSDCCSGEGLVCNTQIHTCQTGIN